MADNKQGNATTGGGGVTTAKELPYSPPQGPKGLSNNSVGLGGTNHGTKVNQGRH